MRALWSERPIALITRLKKFNVAGESWGAHRRNETAGSNAMSLFFANKAASQHCSQQSRQQSLLGDSVLISVLQQVTPIARVRARTMVRPS